MYIKSTQQKKYLIFHAVLSLQGKCKSCGKAFNSKLVGFSAKEIVGISCSWCKYSYHTKNACASACDNDTTCDLGIHAKVCLYTLCGKNGILLSLEKIFVKTSYNIIVQCYLASD